MSDNFPYKPLVSVCTVVRNDAKGLKFTLDNVRKQTYAFIEHIVIDGASEDETLSVLSAAASGLAYSISEADDGIYPAMNKAALQVKGEWIIFLNAGDGFASPSVLEQIFTGEKYKAGLIYGDNEVDYGYFRRQHRCGDLRELAYKHVFSHQALLCRKSLFDKHPFNTNFQYCADFEQFYHFFINKEKFTYKSITISIIKTGGVSEINNISAFQERYDIVKKNQSHFSMHAYFQFWLLHLKLVFFVKKILPKPLIKLITRLKYILRPQH